MPNLFDTTIIPVNGLSCKLSVSIMEPFDKTKGHTLMASITIPHIPHVLLASVMLHDAMLIPDGSIVDELDKQVAFGSAEALLDVDALRAKASQTISQLAAVFADQYFGLPDRPMGGV